VHLLPAPSGELLLRMLQRGVGRGGFRGGGGGVRVDAYPEFDSLWGNPG